MKKSATSGLSGRWRGLTVQAEGSVAGDLRASSKGAVPAVGGRVPKVDAAALLSGRGRFASDVALPNMLHVGLVQSQHAHARITGVDLEEALRLPGVAAAVTAADVPHNQIGYCVADRPVLADGRVRSYADVVAAVAAADERTARYAASKVKVTYEPLPAIFSIEGACANHAVQLHPEKATYTYRPFLEPFYETAPGNVSSHFRLRHGDLDAARARTAAVARGRFTTPRVEHCSLEPHAAVACFDGVNGKLTIWSSTGKPFRTLQQTALALGLRTIDIKFLQLHVGGDFGGKGEPTVEPICALLALRTGRPVKAVFTREQEFILSTARLPFEIDLEMGADDAGRLTYLDGQILVDCGPYNGMAGQISTHAGVMLAGPYDLPAVEVDSLCVYTNNTQGGAFRGFGDPQVTFAREQLLDDLAQQCGKDPARFRLHNIWGDGATTATGQHLDPSVHGVGARDCLKAVTSNSLWTRRTSSPRSGRVRRGVGLAVAHHGLGGGIFAGADTSTVLVKLNLDGTVTVITGVTDVGQGAATTLCQLVASGLGLPLDDVGISSVDTDLAPWEGGASASRIGYLSGNATTEAVGDLRRQIVEVAADLSGAELHNPELSDGGVRASNWAATLRQIAAHGQYCGRQLIGIGRFRREVEQLNADGQGSPYPAFDYGAQVAEVEVDTATGQVRVVQLCVADDVGQVLNLGVVEGQILGAVAQGIGYALMEEMVLQRGQVLNPDFASYRLPRAADIPPVHSIIVEKQQPDGSLGAKGAGEIGIVCTAAAIANAIRDAIGTCVPELPMTPDRILHLLTSQTIDNHFS